VARGQEHVVVQLVGDEQHAAVVRAETQGLHFLGEELGLRRFYLELVDDRDAAFARKLRQDRSHAGAIHLAIELLRKIFVGRVREDLAAATPQGAVRLAGTGAARTLLPPRFLVAPVDVAATLLRPVPGARVRLVGGDDLVDQRLV